MKKFFLFKKKNVVSFTQISLVTLVLVAILGTSFGLEVPHAQAVIPVLIDGDISAPAHSGNWWTNLVTTVEQTIGTISEKAMEYKAFSLDTIAWNIAKIALAQIQKETVRWINSGFEGSPSFVTDLGGFLQDNADRVAGEFIYGSDLKALCTPFQLNIRIALSLKYLKKDPPARCTLSGVVKNVDNFLAGSFQDGGLPGWFQMTIDPNNNFFGASASADSALFGKLQLVKEKDINKLIFGNGFLGKEECNEVSTYNFAAINASTNDQQTKQADIQAGKYDTRKRVCKTVTPGQTISASLNKALGLGEDSLVAADSFNEIISALFQQLAVQVLTGARGLLGTSDAGGDGKPSYLNQINNPRYDTTPGQNTIETHFIDETIKDESAFRALYANIVSKADTILARIKELEALVANQTDDVIWTCSDMSGIRAQVTAIREPAFATQSKSDKNLATLNDLNTHYKTTKQNAQYSMTAAEENLRLSETFLNLQSGSELHRASALPGYQRETDPVVTQLGTLATQLESLCHATPKNGSSGASDSGGGTN